MLLKGSRNTYAVTALVDTLGFLSGIVLTWASPMLPKFAAASPIGRPLTPSESAWLASLHALGAIFGPLLAAVAAPRLGRRPTAALLALPFALSSLLAALAASVPLLCVARLLAGFAVGGTFSLCPVYIMEVAETANRGVLAASTTSFIMAGCLFTYALGPYTTMLQFNLIAGSIALGFLPAWLYFGIETPYHYLKQGREAEARTALTYLRNASPATVEDELQSIKAYLDGLEVSSVRNIVRVKSTRKAIGLGLAHLTFQQFSGIVVILTYLETIFRMSGGSLRPEISAMIVGAMQFGACFQAPLLSEVFGRRRLLLASITGGAGALGVLGAYFYFYEHAYDMGAVGWVPIAALVAYIVFYQMGMGAVPWVLAGELLPANVLATTASLFACCYWMVGFLLTRFFSALADEIGNYSAFWMFSGCCVAWGVFAYVFCFETKGKSFAEIQLILSN